MQYFCGKVSVNESAMQYFYDKVSVNELAMQYFYGKVSVNELAMQYFYGKVSVNESAMQYFCVLRSWKIAPIYLPLRGLPTIQRIIAVNFYSHFNLLDSIATRK